MKEFITQGLELIEWNDSEGTGATGWIAIDTLINGVSGGGLFMHAEATAQEVIDLARTMSLKNTLQSPQFGGGKGGIRFNPSDPRAEQVLRRFLIANKEILKHKWCTGADLNTRNDVIHRIIQDDLHLESGFSSLGKMVSQLYGIANQAINIPERIAYPASPYFALGDCASGYSAAETIHYLCEGNTPRVMIQGFGAVGSSLAYFLQEMQIAQVVGVSDHEGFIYHPEGIDVKELLEQRLNNKSKLCTLKQLLTETNYRKYHYTPRIQAEVDDVYLNRFLSAQTADIFCPCAGRYQLTESVTQNLLANTFSDTMPGNAFIISGANNIFVNNNLIELLQNKDVCVIPEWVSNCGSALLFMESLKVAQTTNEWPAQVLMEISQRVRQFLFNASVSSKNSKANFYKSCIAIALSRLNKNHMAMETTLAD